MPCLLRSLRCTSTCNHSVPPCSPLRRMFVLSTTLFWSFWSFVFRATSAPRDRPSPSRCETQPGVLYYPVPRTGLRAWYEVQCTSTTRMHCSALQSRPMDCSLVAARCVLTECFSRTKAARHPAPPPVALPHSAGTAGKKEAHSIWSTIHSHL